MSDLDTVFQDDWPEHHRSGVVAVVGRPNVGKSTLINRLLGQKIAIVTPRPQTTQRQQIGIYSTQDVQILFVDTPGLHRPGHKLGEYMVTVAQQALRDADLILWLLDVSAPPQTGDQHIAETVNRLRGDTPVILALNKVDLTDAETSSTHRAAYLDLTPHTGDFLISALEGVGVDALMNAIIEHLPLGPRYYPIDQVSEANMRFIAAEVVREKIMLNTTQEIPHAVAVAIEEFKERSEDLSYISATIYVERESQKGIIIGKGGSMIKTIGAEAREELAAMLGTKVYLELNVKVLKNWRSNDKLMARLGYRLSDK